MKANWSSVVNEMQASKIQWQWNCRSVARLSWRVVTAKGARCLSLIHPLKIVHLFGTAPMPFLMRPTVASPCNVFCRTWLTHSVTSFHG